MCSSPATCCTCRHATRTTARPKASARPTRSGFAHRAGANSRASCCSAFRMKQRDGPVTPSIAIRHRKPPSVPGAVPPQLQQFARDALHAALKDPLALDRALGEYLTEPKASVWFETGGGGTVAARRCARPAHANDVRQASRLHQRRELPRQWRRRGADAKTGGPGQSRPARAGGRERSGALASGVLVRSGLDSPNGGKTMTSIPDESGAAHALPTGRFAGRKAFQQLVRDALACAAREGWREIILSDPNFEDWPLGERAVAESLAGVVGNGPPAARCWPVATTMWCGATRASSPGARPGRTSSKREHVHPRIRWSCPARSGVPGGCCSGLIPNAPAASPAANPNAACCCATTCRSG